MVLERTIHGDHLNGVHDVVDVAKQRQEVQVDAPVYKKQDQDEAPMIFCSFHKMLCGLQNGSRGTPLSQEIITIGSACGYVKMHLSSIPSLAHRCALTSDLIAASLSQKVTSVSDLIAASVLFIHRSLSSAIDRCCVK